MKHFLQNWFAYTLLLVSGITLFSQGRPENENQAEISLPGTEAQEGSGPGTLPQGNDGIPEDTIIDAAIAGIFPASEQLSEIGLIQNFDGSIYIFCVEEGVLSIKKGDGKGNTEDYRTEGLPEGLRNIHALSLSASGPWQYAAFIGSENGKEGVYVLQTDHNGELRYCSVPEIRNKGAVSQYTLIGSGLSGASVYILSNGQLSHTTGITADNFNPIHQTITRLNEKIGDAREFKTYRNVFNNYEYGWFTISEDNRKELFLFISGEENFLIREDAGSFDEGNQIYSSVNFSGDLNYTIIRGNTVEIIQGGPDGFFRKAQFSIPAEITRYYEIPLIEKNIGIAIAENGETEQVFAFVNPESGTSEVREWFRMEKGFEPGILYTEEQGIILVYRRDGSWYTSYFDPDLFNEKRIAGLSEDTEIFFTDYNIKAKAGFLEQKNGNKLLLYEFGVGQPILKNSTILPQNTDSALIFFNRKTGEVQAIKSRLYSTSLAINGIFFFCVYDGRNVSIYRSTPESQNIIDLVNIIPLRGR
ncbi:MAG: hypothetical protein LBT16_04935 [Treponema sp.]|nr:hypothetical protein [Treponema sp.]